MTSAAVESVGPNWFTSVMGTGIVANAAATLPVHLPELEIAATVVWLVAVVMLIAITAVFAAQWLVRPATARRHLEHPVMAQFYGAPPMALLTVGAGAVLVGHRVLGEQPALAVDWVLWSAGTVTGLLCAVVVPLWMFTRHRPSPGAAFGGWLVPLVPPMVSAAGGALLVPHTPEGQPRLSLLLLCYAEFGVGLAGSLVVITLVWARLVRHHEGPPALVPTLWIGLGPLGQSMAWWSFTFPVGTVVTGTSELARHSHAVVFAAAAVIFYAGLVLAWALVLARTVRSGLRGVRKAEADPVRTVRAEVRRATGRGSRG
ncbi:TDT family transporter [Saccharopolyspora taberi]|uniref:C4-dicarboxylate ABC transporter n=1 Tax=Saccharopolyspora taberi TaxID=60895 RepID=A0ABN3VHD7_9PSEU